MAAFRFKAMDDAGKPQNGMLEAMSLAAARQQLRARNLLPLEVVRCDPFFARAPGHQFSS